MKNAKDFKEVTGADLQDHNVTSHNVVQYIDDCNNSVGAATTKELIQYSEDYMKLLKKYYHTNKLCINEEKTKFLMINKESSEESSRRF